MALAHCILGKFLGVGCHCFPPKSDYRHINVNEWEKVRDVIYEIRAAQKIYPVNFQVCDTVKTGT